MQAYIREISLSRKHESFLICQRVLHECHEIIFGDVPTQPADPYSSLHVLISFVNSRRKVRPRVEPATVGIGMVLAGAPGMPQLTELMGQVAIEQGRIDEQGEDIKSLEKAQDDVVQGIKPTLHADAAEDDDDLEGSDPEEEVDIKISQENKPKQESGIPITKPSRFESVSARRAVAAQTSPALHMELKGLRKSRLSEDPFGQEDEPFTLAAKSTPSFSAASKHPARMNSVYAADLLNQKYDFAAQMQLLRSNFCRTEVCQCYNIKEL